MEITSGSTLTLNSVIEAGKARRAIATILSSVVPGLGQFLLGKSRSGIAFILGFCFLSFLYWPVRLPGRYFGIQALLTAMMILCSASAWHALRSRTVRGFQPALWWLVLILPLALIASFVHSNWLLLVAGFRPFDVPSTGMERTIMQGDRVLVDLRHYREDPPRRGEVVIFRKEGIIYVKRVIAIEGDTVEGKNGTVFLNKQKLEEPYVMHLGNAPDGLNTFGPVVVDPHEVFVMGDNRDVSRDSRMTDFGLIANSSMAGRCLYILRSKSGKAGRDLP